MNFALLDVDADVLRLARQLARSEDDRISVCIAAGAATEELQTLAPKADFDADWESLLLEGVVDVVIVGRADTADARADKLKKLVQAKVPLIVVHPACEAIVGYEIEMIRRDVGGTIVPYCPGAGGATSRAMQNALADPSVAPVEQLTCERRLPSRERTEVLVTLSRDVALLREIVGPFKSVGAIGALKDQTHGVSLAVQLAAENGCLVRWSLDPSAGDAEARVALLGRAGKATATLADNGSWSVQLPNQAALVDDGADDVQRLVAAVTGESNVQPTWIEACRAQEVVDTIPRCLARNKTIELYNEEHTEENAFKGVMAVGGCLIMMLGLLMLLVIAIVEGLQLPLHQYTLWSAWPLYFCAAFGFFLFLQLLRFVARGR